MLNEVCRPSDSNRYDRSETSVMFFKKTNHLLHNDPYVEGGISFNDNKLSFCSS